MAHPSVSARSVMALFATSLLVASCGGAGTGETAAASKAPAAVVTAAPAAAAPAAPAAAPAAATAKAIILAGDTVWGPNGLTDDEKTYLSCVQGNRIPQGRQIVWRFRVLDGATGKSLDDKSVKTVVLTLPDGKALNLKYGGHGGPNKTDDFFWTTSFDVPKDYPTGSFPYKLVATSNDGLTATYGEFNMATSKLQIVAAGKR